MDQDTGAIRADIERERREVGETVAALAEKADVKGQAQRKLAETRENIDRKKSEVIASGQHVAGLDDAPGADKRKRQMITAAAVGAGILVLAALVRRR
jgi:ElaB/YqjD/DUF883 family membrane-anchored ribosome-binding protein